MFFLGGFIKQLYKCPAQDMKEACQALYEASELIQLRIHIRSEALEHHCQKHKKIHFFESGDLDMDYIINVYWMKAVYYQDLEANVRDMIFQRTTFAAKNPKPPEVISHKIRPIAPTPRPSEVVSNKSRPMAPIPPEVVSNKSRPMAPIPWPEPTSDPLKALEAISTASTSNL